MEFIITELVTTFGISRPMAIVIMLLIFGCGASLVTLSALIVRVKMHADHFDVNDKNIDRAKNSAESAYDVALDAMKTAYHTKGVLEGLKIKPIITDIDDTITSTNQK